MSASTFAYASGLPEPNREPVVRRDIRDSPIELAIVIPTYNERRNICPLIDALKYALSGIEWEAIFVDDNSPDGTADEIRSVAATDRRVRVIERVGRRGLSSACVEGMLATAACYIAVMDADLQHDEKILPEMLSRMKSQRFDVVVASRRAVGGSVGDFAKGRDLLSVLGSGLSRLICRMEVSDPMSGFFLLNRPFFSQVAPRLSGTGFKILLDLLASSVGTVRISEVPYRFRGRLSGESKFGVKAGFDYLRLIFEKVIKRVIPDLPSRKGQSDGQLISANS